jgi:hypothetical protein
LTAARSGMADWAPSRVQARAPMEGRTAGSGDRIPAVGVHDGYGHARGRAGDSVLFARSHWSFFLSHWT